MSLLGGSKKPDEQAQSATKDNRKTAREEAREVAKKLGENYKSPVSPQDDSYTLKNIPLVNIYSEYNPRTRFVDHDNPGVNRLSEDHEAFSSNEQVINELKDFADNLKEQPLYTPISVYEGADRKFYIIYGHRRYYATRIAFGDSHSITAKVYRRKPDRFAQSQYNENSSRKSLDLQSDLLGFEAAKKELFESIQDRRLSVRKTADSLGISKTKVGIFNQVLNNQDLYQAVMKYEIVTYKALQDMIEQRSDDADLTRRAPVKRSKKSKTSESNAGVERDQSSDSFALTINDSVVLKVLRDKFPEFEFSDEEIQHKGLLANKLSSYLNKVYLDKPE